MEVKSGLDHNQECAHGREGGKTARRGSIVKHICVQVL